MNDARPYPHTEAELRVQLAACYRLVAHFGMDDLIYNHISARVPGAAHHFLINPYGLLFSEVTASCLVKIDLDGNKVEPSDFDVNRAGFIIHSAVHAARPDALCVLHTHSDAGTAIAALPNGLAPVSQFAMRYQGHTGFHDYEGVALGTDERERLVRDLGTHHTLVLRHHGVLTVGRTIPEAFILMYYFEKAARVQLLAQSGVAPGGRLVWPAQEVTDLASRQFNDFHGDILPPGTREWPAFMRLLGGCRALGRARVGPERGLRLGAKRSHAEWHGEHLQRRIIPLSGPTRRAGETFGLGRRCRLVV